MAVGAGKSVVLLASGTGGPDAAAITDALLQAASGKGGSKAETTTTADADANDSDESDEEAGVGGGEGGGEGKKAAPPVVRWEAVSSGKGKAKGVAGVGGVGSAGARVVLR